MAIIFIEKSKCPLCGKVFANEQELLLFPHMMANLKDPLKERLYFSAKNMSTDLKTKPTSTENWWHHRIRYTWV